MTGTNGHVDVCSAPDCPHPQFRGEEAKAQGHMTIQTRSGVRHYHFGCYWRLFRHATKGAGL